MTAPLVWPCAGTPGDVLQAALERVLNEATGLTASGTKLLPAYLRWATDSVSRLRTHLGNHDVDRLVRTSTFWTALGLSPESPVIAHLIPGELHARQDDLRQVLASVTSFRQRFLDVPEAALLLVPDTNVLIAHAESAREADWRGIVHHYVRHFDTVRLLIPLVVIDELDKLKQHTNQKTRTGARVMLKLIHGLIGNRPESRPVLQEATQTSGRVTIEVLMESPEHIRLPRADDELIDVVARLRGMLGERTVFTTFDTGADLRAAVKGIKHVRLEHPH